MGLDTIKDLAPVEPLSEISPEEADRLIERIRKIAESVCKDFLGDDWQKGKHSSRKISDFTARVECGFFRKEDGEELQVAFFTLSNIGGVLSFCFDKSGGGLRHLAFGGRQIMFTSLLGSLNTDTSEGILAKDVFKLLKDFFAANTEAGKKHTRGKVAAAAGVKA
jgi:hypothetical protein